jgi:RNA polymerase sigma-70 factor, ECF subfamily
VVRRFNSEDSAGRALAVLYREHATATYRFALHLCGAPADAEDLTQTAFLEAHRKLLGGGDLVRPRAWLVSVVRTRALNLRRDQHEIPVHGHRLELLAGAVDPVDTGDELGRIRAVLWSLPEAQHHAFVLRHWCDMPNRDIAAALATTESAVESLLVRARKALAGIDDLPPECIAIRDRLTQGLPETHHARVHLAGCSQCRSTRERVARTAAIAATLALTPQLTVAHALAATVPGFTTAAASSAGTGMASATATKALLTKALVTTLAVGTTAAALHTGVLPIPLLQHHSHRTTAPATTRAPTEPHPAAATSTPHRVTSQFTASAVVPAAHRDSRHRNSASPGHHSDAIAAHATSTDDSTTHDSQGGTTQDSHGGSTNNQQESSGGDGSATDSTRSGGSTDTNSGSDGQSGSANSQD